MHNFLALTVTTHDILLIKKEKTKKSVCLLSLSSFLFNSTNDSFSHFMISNQIEGQELV